MSVTRCSDTTVALFLIIAPPAVQGWCVMKPNNFRIPVVAERKPTADELCLQALIAKHECLAMYGRANYSTSGRTMEACRREFDEAIEHYKKLAWKDER